MTNAQQGEADITKAYNTTNIKLEAVLQCDRSNVAGQQGSKIVIGNKDTETNYHQERETRQTPYKRKIASPDKCKDGSFSQLQLAT